MPALRLTQQVAEAFLPTPPDVLGVAVSGGGDSMALLHLMHNFCTLHASRLRAVTVNHGLRSGAVSEAEAVADFCKSLGVQHDTLMWDDWDGQGNLQNEARKARYGRIAHWAHTLGLSTVAVGHTADDQAETFLMRLSRRSGVSGLAGMPQRTTREGITWVRPLLAASRSDLRVYLRQQQIDWTEDPSNEDTTFERIRARKALAHLAPLGIDAACLSVVAGHMQKADAALGWQTFLAARDIAQVEAGAVVMCERKLRVLPEEISRRLLVHAVNWISGSTYCARRAAVANLMAALRKGTGGTADGVHVRRVGSSIWVFRELNAVRDLRAGADTLWDDRWLLSQNGAGRDNPGDLTIRALDTDGIAQCPDWRDSGLPHDVLLSTPAVWRGDTLVAAPLAGLGETWHADVDGGGETFFASLLTH